MSQVNGHGHSDATVLCCCPARHARKDLYADSKEVQGKAPHSALRLFIVARSLAICMSSKEELFYFSQQTKPMQWNPLICESVTEFD